MYASATDPETPGFKDVLDGNNGLFTAKPGFDLVSGLGVPIWSELGPDLLATSAGAAAVGVVSPVQRPVRSATPTLTAGYTRTLTAPISVTVPQGGTYSGFSVGETVQGCALQTAAPPTTAQLDADPEQGEHSLLLTAFDDARVCHLSSATVVYDTVAPSATVRAALLSASGTQVRLTLGGTDATSGIAAWDVQARDERGKLTYYAVSSAASRTITAFKPGGRYTVKVRAHDRAGNVGPQTTLLVTLALDDTAFSRNGAWTRSARRGDYGGTHLGSQQRGASLSLTMLTRRVDGYFLKGPNQGYVDVYLDGRRTTRLDLYAPSTTVYRPILAQWQSVGAHSIRLVATGTHRAASKGSFLILDGVLVLR